MPVTKVMSIVEYEDREFRFLGIQNDVIEYRLQDQDVLISKRYKIDHDSYQIHAEIEYKNTSEMSKKIISDISSYVLDMSILKGDDVGNIQREKGLYEYSFLSGQKSQ